MTTTTDVTRRPEWSNTVDMGKGTRNVSGVFNMIFNGDGRIQINTDRGPVRCKGKTFTFRGEFVRNPDGTMADGKYAHTVRESTRYEDPTPAVRKLIIEAARTFAETEYTEEQDAAGTLAVAEDALRRARGELDSLAAALAEAANRRDEATTRVMSAQARCTQLASLRGE